MFIPALFVIARNWKQPKGPSIKQSSIHAMEYYSAEKENKLFIHTIIWMNLKSIMLNEESQSQKVTYYIIPFYNTLEMTKF